MTSRDAERLITPPRPPLFMSQWLNTDLEPRLADIGGKSVLPEAFRTLCPDCVYHGLTQARSVHGALSSHDLVVLGMHTVLEHHDAMTPSPLEAFLYAYGITFPGGGRQTEQAVPETMAACRMRDIPSTTPIDRPGHPRRQYFGRISDLQLELHLAMLLAGSTACSENSGARDGASGRSGSGEDGRAVC